MGVVTLRKGVTGGPDIPESVYVSDGRKPVTAPAVATTAAVSGAAPRARGPTGFVERLGRFPNEHPA